MRLIDADEFWDIFDYEAAAEVSDYYGNGFTYSEIKRILNKTPTADAELIRHGTWMTKNCGVQFWFCSKCGYTFEDWPMDLPFLPSYCPECGAKMDKRGDKG